MTTELAFDLTTIVPTSHADTDARAAFDALVRPAWIGDRRPSSGSASGCARSPPATETLHVLSFSLAWERPARRRMVLRAAILSIPNRKRTSS